MPHKQVSEEAPLQIRLDLKLPGTRDMSPQTHRLRHQGCPGAPPPPIPKHLDRGLINTKILFPEGPPREEVPAGHKTPIGFWEALRLGAQLDSGARGQWPVGASAGTLEASGQCQVREPVP